jgi:C4-type Zn-finger protein
MMIEENMEEQKISFSCPVCARKTDYPVTQMVEGTALTCPFCKLTLTLHGHMLQDVQREIQKLKEK